MREHKNSSKQVAA